MLIGRTATIFCVDPLCKPSVVPEPEYFCNITPIISVADSAGLFSVPSVDEIWEAVRNLPQESAAGPDGFTG